MIDRCLLKPCSSLGFSSVCFYNVLDLEDSSGEINFVLSNHHLQMTTTVCAKFIESTRSNYTSK